MSDLRPRDRSSRVSGIARHGQLRKAGPWGTFFKLIGIAMAVVLVSTVSIAGVTFYQLTSALSSGGVEIAGDETDIDDIAAIEGGFNILIVGSDECTEDCEGYGVRGSRLNDVNILLHVSEDQTNAVAVSIPRDLVVPIPACDAEDGSGTNSAMSAQPINVALSDGGLACVAKTVTELTGLDIQFAGLITFAGVIAMSNAIGGVPVCVTNAVTDARTGLDLKAGTTTLKGKQALAFLRSRHVVGDGSDLSRISSQQVYMSSLVRTLQSADTLGDVTKLYSLAKAATENMELSKNFLQVDTLVSIALALKDIPSKNITFVQYPSTTGVGGVYEGKVAPVQPDATQMMEYIANDEQFTVKDLGTRGAVTEDPDATATPTEEATETPTETATETPTETATETPTETATEEPSVGSGSTADQATCAVTK
jgi:LCP family protein required for cell wall assembly